MSVCTDADTVCLKGARARAYCRRTVCLAPTSGHPVALPAADLPRPDVAVTTHSTDDGSKTDLSVVISRDGKAKTYTVDGTGGGLGPIKEVVEKIIADPNTAEWLPAGKRY